MSASAGSTAAFGLAAWASGFVFALGLGLSGMTRPDRVAGFLDVGGDWKPALALVMGGALAVMAVAWRFVPRLGQPRLAERFEVPAGTAVDGRLLGGAALFGVGWALAGYCPGPAIVSIAAGSSKALLFVVAMVVGARLVDVAERFLAPRLGTASS